MRYSLIVFFVLITTYFLDRVFAQYVYFLAFEYGFFDADKLVSLEGIKQFYFLKGFWYFFWWGFLIFSFIAFLANHFAEPLMDLTLKSDSDESDEESYEDSKPSSRKRPRRPSHRYKSKRYRA